MEDLISRQTVIDGLEFVIEHGIETYGAHSISAEKMLEFVRELPTVQPNIVRCKYCQYGILDNDFPHQRFCKFKGDEWNNDDYFCGHAKKREEAT